MHFIVWSSNIFFFVIPYSTGTQYGSDIDWLGTSLCFYKYHNQEEEYWQQFWTIFCFYVPLFLLICGTVYHTYKLWKRFKYLRDVHTTAIKERHAFIKEAQEARKQSTFRRSSAPQASFHDRLISVAEVHAGNSILDLVRSTIWYPLALLGCWTPNFLQYAMYMYVSSTKYQSRKEFPRLHVFLDVLGVVTYSLGISYSVCSVLIFFGVKPEARIAWKRLLRECLIRLNLVKGTDMEKHAIGLAKRGESPRAAPRKKSTNTLDSRANSVISEMFGEEGEQQEDLENTDLDSSVDEDADANERVDYDNEEYVYEDGIYETASAMMSTMTSRLSNGRASDTISVGGEIYGAGSEPASTFTSMAQRQVAGKADTAQIQLVQAAQRNATATGAGAGASTVNALHSKE